MTGQPIPPPTRAPVALSSTDRTNLLKPNALSAYLSFAPQDPSIFASGQTGYYKQTARVDLPTGWPPGTTNYTDIPITGKSANWDQLLIYAGSFGRGLLVYIGTAAGANDIGTFRTRKWTAATNYIYIEEVGPGDPGIRPQSLQMASIADGQYVTVMIDRALWPALTRITFSGGVGTFYKDYDRVYAGETLWGPWTLNLGAHVAGFVDPTTGLMRVSFTPKSTFPPFSGSNNAPMGIFADNNPIVYIWGCVIAPTSGGSYSDAIRLNDVPVTGAEVVYDFPPGFYAVVCTATYQIATVPTACTAAFFSVGQQLVVSAVRFVWAHDGVVGDGSAAVFPAIPITSINSDEMNTDGRNMSVTINDNVYSNYRKNTLVQYWETPSWGGFDVPSATRVFTGFIDTVDMSTQDGLKQTSVHILGSAAMLAKIPASSNRLDDPSDYATSTLNCPDTWQEWNGPSVEGFVHYLLAYHEANFLRLFDYNWIDVFDGTTGGGNWYYPCVGLQVNAGSIWSQVKSVCQRFGLNAGCDSTGAFWMRPDPSMLLYTHRTTDASGTPPYATVSLRDSIDETIYSEVTWPEAIITKVNKVNGSAFFWDYNLHPTDPQKAVLSVWPGGSMGYGTDEDQMTDLYVFDQDHLNQLVGLRAAVINNPNVGIRVTIPTNRDVYEPAHWSFISLSIPSELDPQGGGLEARFIVKSRSKRVNIEEGTAEITLTLDRETYGQPGVTVPITGRIIPPPPPPPGVDCDMTGDTGVTIAPYMTFTKDSPTQYTLSAISNPNLAYGDSIVSALFTCGIYRRLSFVTTGFTWQSGPSGGVYPGGYVCKPGTEPVPGWAGDIPVSISDPINDATYGMNNRCLRSFNIRSATPFSVVVTVSTDGTCP